MDTYDVFQPGIVELISNYMREKDILQLAITSRRMFKILFESYTSSITDIQDIERMICHNFQETELLNRKYNLFLINMRVQLLFKKIT